MQILEAGCFIIIGRTTSGKVFRPSDWSHRLCGSMSTFTDGKLRYSSNVRPILQGEDNAVFVAEELKDSDPETWTFLLNFAKDNSLQIEWPDVCLLPEE
jgi:Protein of unknown function (DUF3579)